MFSSHFPYSVCDNNKTGDIKRTQGKENIENKFSVEMKKITNFFIIENIVPQKRSVLPHACEDIINRFGVFHKAQLQK